MAIVPLRNQREFSLVNEHGVKFYGSYLILVLMKHFSHVSESKNKEGVTDIFFGMKVSRKFSKKAVIRNKAKRRIRHLVRNVVDGQNIDTRDTALIVIPKKGLERVNFKALSYDFNKSFTKILESL